MSKIIFIASNEYVPWGGSEYCWANAVARLAKQGIEVAISVKCWPTPVKQVEHLRSLGCRIFLRPPEPRSLPVRIIRKLPPWREHRLNHVRKIASGADLVVVSQGGNTDGLPWMEALRAAGCKYAAIAEGGSIAWWPEDELAERLAKAYEAAAGAYFVSEALLDLSRRQFVAPLKHGKVIRNPFNVAYEASPAWPKHNERVSIAFVSRLEIAGKGHDVLLQVLSLPHWRERDLRVTLYGDGPNERSLRRMIADAKLTSVQFGGFVHNIEEIWANHHAFMLPSRHEGMPLTLVEAMLCGRPAIITDVGGVRELVRDGVNGFLAKAPTVELFDEAMNRAWENRHRFKEMGEQAAIDVRKFVGPDPTGDFVRELLALVDSPAPFMSTVHSTEQNAVSNPESSHYEQKGEEKANRYTKHKSAGAN